MPNNLPPRSLNPPDDLTQALHMIRFDNVSKRYNGGCQALTNISLHVRPGELIFLSGHSGAGKSTLLKLIALIERPTRGTRRPI